MNFWNNTYPSNSDFVGKIVEYFPINNELLSGEKTILGTINVIVPLYLVVPQTVPIVSSGDDNNHLGLYNDVYIPSPYKEHLKTKGKKCRPLSHNNNRQQMNNTCREEKVESHNFDLFTM